MNKKMIGVMLLFLLVIPLLSGCRGVLDIPNKSKMLAALGKDYLEEKYDETFTFVREESTRSYYSPLDFFDLNVSGQGCAFFTCDGIEGEISVYMSGTGSEWWCQSDNYVDLYYKEDMTQYISQVTCDIWGDNRVDYNPNIITNDGGFPEFSEYRQTVKLHDDLDIYVTASTDSEENRQRFIDEMKNAFPEGCSMSLCIVKDGTPLNEIDIGEYDLLFSLADYEEEDFDVIRVCIITRKEEKTYVGERQMFVKRTK